jgi:hypothetical protein
MTNIERALSIRNPWASLIMGGFKLIENRTWKTDHRGPILIHAGKLVDRLALPDAAQFIDTNAMPSGYLGTVDLVDVHWGGEHDCCGFWAQQNVFHWRLDNPQPFAEPIPGLGRLGLFIPPVDVQERILCERKAAA